MPPFLDVDAFAAPSSVDPAGVQDRRARLRLVTVAMMRPGAKLASYRLLADGAGAGAAPRTGSSWSSATDRRARTSKRRSRRSRRSAFDSSASRTRRRWPRGFARSDLFVWPAIDEAFGMALLEAQACGVPVVAGDGGGVGAVVAAGRTGLLVAPGDANAFAEAVRRLLSDHAHCGERMASEAAAYARSRHGLPAAAARLDAVLRRVTAEHVPRAPAQSTVAAAR